MNKQRRKTINDISNGIRTLQTQIDNLKDEDLKFKFNQLIKKWEMDNPEISDTQFNAMYGLSDNNNSIGILPDNIGAPNPYSSIGRNYNPYNSNGNIGNPYSSDTNLNLYNGSNQMSYSTILKK